MSDRDATEARREVAELHRLAMDAHREGQFRTMVDLLERTATMAERLDDLPLLIRERYWLASARRMVGQYAAAFTGYVWLVGLATDPSHSQHAADDDTAWYLANAFTDIVDVGRFMPEMSTDNLLRVLADGLTWLERTGRPHWAAGIRNQRATLLRGRGDWIGARREAEAGLALQRRHPNAPGFTLAMHLLVLAVILRGQDPPEHARAKELAEEALSVSQSAHDRRVAYLQLVYAELGLGDLPAAQRAAEEQLACARSMESPEALSSAYRLLGQVQRDAGRVADAAATVAQQWRWARILGRVDSNRNALVDCARVRLLQAYERVGLLFEDELPRALAADIDRRPALVAVASAWRFLRWARPLSQQIDRARGTRAFQKALDDLREEVDDLAGLLGS